MPQPLRYSINLTLDGCCSHTAGIPDEELHRHAATWIASADILLFGRVTYQMMESAWRAPRAPGRPAWTEPFGEAIDAVKKYVVSSTLPKVDWNAEFLRGDLATEVRKLKAMPGRGIATGGVMLPKALAELGLIDEYQFVIHPRIIGRGPALWGGLPAPLDLTLTGREEFKSGAVVLRYAPKGNG